MIERISCDQNDADAKQENDDKKEEKKRRRALFFLIFKKRLRRTLSVAAALILKQATRRVTYRNTCSHRSFVQKKMCLSA